MLGHLRDAAFIVAEDEAKASAQLDRILAEFTEDWTPRPVRLMTQGDEMLIVHCSFGAMMLCVCGTQVSGQ